MTLKSNVKLEEKPPCGFENDLRILANFNQSIQKPKNEQSSYFWRHWILMKNLKEKWLVLSKMTWAIWQIFTKVHLKVEKFGLLLGHFIESRNCMSSKFSGDLCVMTMKNDVKLDQKLTGQFKIDMRNLTIFDSIIQKSQ